MLKLLIQLLKLSDEEMDTYRHPFREAGEDYCPTLTWPRQIPIEGESENVINIVETYPKWLSTSDIPKLFINAEPGSVLTGNAREFCRSWNNQEEVTVKGIHFIQGDSPDEIGQAGQRSLTKLMGLMFNFFATKL